MRQGWQIYVNQNGMFTINIVQSASRLYKIYGMVCYVFLALHNMLLPCYKPCWLFAFKICFATHQFCCSIEVHPLQRKILGLSLNILTFSFHSVPLP